jgi:hypothetical protein
MGNPDNLRIGTFDVYVNNVLQGYTKGGQDVMFNHEYVDMTVDQYGSTPLDKILSGQDLRVTIRYAEITRTTLAAALPDAQFNQGSGGDSKIGFGREAGFSLRSVAKELRLHPRNKASNDLSEDIYIWLAAPINNIELPYRVDEQRVLEVEYQAFVDESQPDNYKLGRVGDATIS